MGGPAWWLGPEKLCMGADGGGCVRRFRGTGRAQEERAVTERHDAAVVECGPGDGPRGGCVEPAAGHAVGFSVEGGEVCAGAGVVLCGEPCFAHAEGGGEKGRPVWDGEGESGGRATSEVAQLGGG